MLYSEPYNQKQAQSLADNKKINVSRKRPLPSATTGHTAISCWGLLSVLCIATNVLPNTPAAHGFTLTTTTTTLLKRDLSASSSLAASRRLAEVQEVKPLKESPAERRRRAMQVMDRQQMESALTGVDSQMAELLNLIHMEEGQAQAAAAGPTQETKRPKGRPDSVPGAMNYATMIKYRERRDVLDYVKEHGMSEAEYEAVAPYLKKGVVEITSNRTPSKVKGERETNAPTRPATVERNTNSETTTTTGSATNTSHAKSALKKRKRVVKNLPKRRSSSTQTAQQKKKQQEQDEATLTKTSNRRTNGLDLQKYYRTELLSADEEYSLGMKVQFMVRCEWVHEGLAIRHGRLPTMEEWAYACGFKQEDPTFLATEADQGLRPPGAETMFEERDPSTFVGNGQVGTAGPGRGRGRERKPPPSKLGPFVDDSEYRAKLRAKEIDEIPKNLKPINRGTPTDFVELLMTAREAKQRMVQSNMRLVVSIARKYCNSGVSLQDLVQEGSLGLSRAAEKFEPTKGFKFSTYASWWIQQAIFRSIAYHSRNIRLPVHIHNLLNRVHKVKSTLQADTGRAPTNEEIAEELGMTLPKYNKMLRLTKRSISLEQPKYKNNPKDMFHEGDDLLGDTISSTSALSDEYTPEKRVDRSLFYEDLMGMLDILEEDERRVICARYGLSDGLTRTVTAVSNEMRVSKAWVRSQECRALRKLRRPWYEKKLKQHEDALNSDE